MILEKTKRNNSEWVPLWHKNKIRCDLKFCCYFNIPFSYIGSCTPGKNVGSVNYCQYLFIIISLCKAEQKVYM